ncbi:DUF4169 family protein [Rhodobacterales bacterium HKCCSP123]|nr:DUF4169 family protein [Rhodobacterales bacterium HKCCSP123]
MARDVINLGRVRKQRARDEKRRAADANAARFGRTRAEREAEEARAKAEAAHLDGHRRTPAEPTGEPEE